MRPTKFANRTLLLPKSPQQPVARQCQPRMSDETRFVACLQPACKGVQPTLTTWRRSSKRVLRPQVRRKVAPSRRAPRGVPTAATAHRARRGDGLAGCISRNTLRQSQTAACNRGRRSKIREPDMPRAPEANQGIQLQDLRPASKEPRAARSGTCGFSTGDPPKKLRHAPPGWCSHLRDNWPG